MNNTFIGREAGAEIELGKEYPSNKVIIGDNIRNLEPNQPDVVYIGENILLSKKVWDAICGALENGELYHSQEKLEC